MSAPACVQDNPRNRQTEPERTYICIFFEYIYKPSSRPSFSGSWKIPAINGRK